MAKNEIESKYGRYLQELASRPTDRMIGKDAGTYDHENRWRRKAAVIVAAAHYMARQDR